MSNVLVPWPLHTNVTFTSASDNLVCSWTKTEYQIDTNRIEICLVYILGEHNWLKKYKKKILSLTFSCLFTQIFLKE